MKQVIGFLVILCCFPLLLFLGNKISTEINVASAYKEQIQATLTLPEIRSQLPITMVDQEGRTFSEEYVEWRHPIKLSHVPEIVKHTFLLSEDKEFYNHIGFDVSAIMRAIAANSSAQSIQQGGSTITQQLVRMRYLSEEKSYERKLLELFHAYELEQMYDKEQIFQMYLNEMYFSNHVYGIGAAATYYFSKPLSELSLAQMVFLCAIPNNPSLYNPLKSFDNTKERQERLIEILLTNGIISQEEAKTYKEEEIILNVKEKVQRHPSYSTYVLEELKWLIADNEGLTNKLEKAKNEEDRKLIYEKINLKLQQLLESGITIHTALDPQKQKDDEQNINSLLTINGLQASTVVIDNKTREIISIYAGKDYKKFDFHRAYQGARQPGSSFKPLIIYAPLFETTNYTPESTVNGGRYCIGNFCPQNYGGGIYGNVTISTAFQYSYNTSAVKLLNSIGLETAFQFINQFHFNSIMQSDYTYAAALGGLTKGVTSLELADAYTSFIDGTYTRAHSIRKVTDLDGHTLYSWPSDRKMIWSPTTVKYMRSLLNDVVKNGTGRGLYSRSAYLGAKTGTTNDYKDFWLAGLSSDYTAAVWLGYDQPKSMLSLEDDKIHFQIFNTIMNK